MLQGARPRPRMRKRFSPRLRQWTLKVAWANLWRVYPDMDIDDLIAVADLVFYQCAARYPNTRIKHFASLYRVSYVNRIHRHAMERTKKVGVAASALCGSVDLLAMQLAKGRADDRMKMNTLVREAPRPVRRLVRMLVPQTQAEPLTGLNGTADVGYNDPDDVPQRRPSEKLNEFFCRLAGENPNRVNLVDMVLKSFGAEDQRELYV